MTLGPVADQTTAAPASTASPTQYDAVTGSLAFGMAADDALGNLTKALAACKEDAAERDKQQAAAHALAIDDYKRQLDALRKKLEEASTISVEASKASAIASAESSKLAYESILLLTGGSAPDSAKKADSLDGFTPEPAK